MTLLKTILAGLMLALAYLPGYSQGDKDLIQFSGVVITGDSLAPVPFANVAVEELGRGTMTDTYGYFSFVARKGDRITFSAVGFRKSYFDIPDTLQEDKYSLIQILENDTILLQETVIYPWPTYDDFKQAFLAMEVPETDYDRAQRNLNNADMIARRAEMPADGSENFKYTMQNMQSRLYYAGQAPPVNLLNPFAWAQFIESWKRGDFKKK